MIEWSEPGFILSLRRHGETAAIITALTASRGRRAGLVPGGASARKQASLQPGSLLQLRWTARLDEHLGQFSAEPAGPAASRWLDDPRRLAVLTALCALAETALPEREPCPDLFDSFAVVLARLDGPRPEADYLLWEMMLLIELGYSLDLSACALTGSREDLAWVSPKSGRAVSRTAGAPWADRLLPLPPLLLAGEQDQPPLQEVLAGLHLTGYFLERHGGISLPPARARLIDRLTRSLADPA